ncbi:MAG: glycosyltransferase [Syntrophomonadaceae bacterium]
MNQLVSIIIPVYNVEKYLRRCLDSVIDQTYKNLEIIIINDGSPDQSQAIIDEYSARDSRIRSLVQKNQTLGIARNTGMKVARGDYLMFVDSDDYLEPDGVAVMIHNALVTEADVVVANNKKLADELRKERKIADKVLTAEEMCNPAWRFDYFIDPAYGITVWGKLYKHDFVRSTGVLFESNHLISGEDILFNLLLFTHEPRVSSVNQHVYVYCINEGSITHSYRPRLSQRYLALLEIYHDQLTKMGKLDDFQDLLAYLILRFISTCCYNEYIYSANRYAAIKEHLTNLMQSDIVKTSVRDVARGKYINVIGKRNQTYTRLQASLLEHNWLDMVVMLRMLRYKLM